MDDLNDGGTGIDDLNAEGAGADGVDTGDQQYDGDVADSSGGDESGNEEAAPPEYVVLKGNCIRHDGVVYRKIRAFWYLVMTLLACWLLALLLIFRFCASVYSLRPRRLALLRVITMGVDWDLHL